MANGEIMDPPAPSPPNLPLYPELIFRAIEAVDTINGANKTAFSRHIKEVYGPMPEIYCTILAHHLNRMKKSGDLILLKNKYVKFDPNAPHRGRGRPPMAKSSPPPDTVNPVETVSPSTMAPPETEVSSCRPRGRPHKNVNPVESVTAPKSEASSPRPRGRHPMIINAVAPVASLTKQSPAVSGRKRGRPSKASKTSDETPKVAPTPSPKTVNPVAHVAPLTKESPAVSGRKRGRPIKASKTSDETPKVGPTPNPRTVNPVAHVAPLTKESPAVSGRKRGRPSKASKTSDETPKVAPTPSGTSRGRGWPPKVKLQLVLD